MTTIANQRLETIEKLYQNASTCDGLADEYKHWMKEFESVMLSDDTNVAPLRRSVAKALYDRMKKAHEAAVKEAADHRVRATQVEVALHASTSRNGSEE